MRRAPLALLAAVMVVSLPPSFASQQEPKLTLRMKVAQLVMFSVAGTSLTDSERATMREHHLGNVILFADNYRDREQLRALTDAIQKAAGPYGALISVDQEGGIVKRMPDMPPYMSAPEMGADGRRSVAFDQGSATARALKRAGVNIDLAPVGDLDLPPNHVMRSRAFGPKPGPVARLSNAFARGLRSRRVAATAKHFPGLGGGSMNTDDGRSYVRRSKWKLHHIDAQPFQRMVEGDIGLMMLSHAMYVHDGGEVPASLSHYIASKRLRKEFGFEGVAISDALEPVAWRFGGDVSKTCPATIRAGVDIALLTGGPGAAVGCVNAIVKEVRAGTIARSRINEALARVLALKSWLRLPVDDS